MAANLTLLLLSDNDEVAVVVRHALSIDEMDDNLPQHSFHHVGIDILDFDFDSSCDTVLLFTCVTRHSKLTHTATTHHSTLNTQHHHPPP
eukprot:scaffold1349_cov74-Skeletonema_dohrnii-CCMP3373.AAC.2